MHPILAEIIRCKGVPTLSVLRLWQHQLRDVIAPLVQAGEIAQVHAEATSAPPAPRKGRG